MEKKRCKMCCRPFSPYIIIKGIKIQHNRKNHCLRCIPLAKKTIQREIEGVYPKQKPPKIEKPILQSLSPKPKPEKIKPVIPTISYQCKRCKSRFDKRPISNGKQRILCDECRQIKVDEKEMKKRCLHYKGNKCLLCGYFRCPQALHFHHLIPSDKEFSIGQEYFHLWEDIQKELDKCIIACANCHQEIHSGYYTLDTLVQLERQRVTLTFPLHSYVPYRKLYNGIL